MDGKPSIRVMSKTQILACLKPSTAGAQRSIQYSRKIISNKRNSTPLISTSIYARKKSSHPSTKKMEACNFITVNNVLSLVSCKRLTSCQTMMAIRPFRKQNDVLLTDSQKMLLKNSDRIKRVVWNQNNESLIPLVVSADFIMDQDSFWSEPKVNSSINRSWKEIHKKYFVVWMCRSEKGFKILKQYAQKCELPLNAVFIHQKKQRLTVDYSPLRKQILKVYGGSLDQVIVVECLKLNVKYCLEQNTFLGKIPLTFDSQFKVCYIRCQSSAQGLLKVVEVCKQFRDKKPERIQKLHSIGVYIKDYFQEIQSEKWSMEKGTSALTQETDRPDEDEAELAVENYRKDLIETMMKQKGRGFQHEGFSINYIVGDIIKRNYYPLMERAINRQKARLIAEEAAPMQMQTCAQLEIENTFFQYLD